MNQEPTTTTANPFAQQVAIRDEAQVQVSSARAVAEAQAGFAIAQRFPRNESACYEKIINACRRKDLAEISAYQFSRGGTKIYGPSIHLLRAVAKRWGNLDFGWSELSRKNGESSITAFATDLETNTRTSLNFTVKHWRDTKSGGHALTEERDIYELCANQAARRVRACLEAVIDEDIVNAALGQCEKTLSTGHTEPLMDRAKKMTLAFSDMGVTHVMIEKRLQHKLDAISEGEMVQLRRIYQAIKDGMGKREEFFDFVAEPEKPSKMNGTKTPVVDDGDGTDLGPKRQKTAEEISDQMRETKSATEVGSTGPTATEKTEPVKQPRKPREKPASVVVQETAPEPKTQAEQAERVPATEALMTRRSQVIDPSGLTAIQLCNALEAALKEEGVTEAEVLKYLVSKNAARPEQKKLEFLATPKLQSLATQIDVVCANIRMNRTETNG